MATLYYDKEKDPKPKTYETIIVEDDTNEYKLAKIPEGDNETSTSWWRDHSKCNNKWVVISIIIGVTAVIVGVLLILTFSLAKKSFK